MEIEPSNLICPKCLKGGYVNYIGQSYKYIAKCYNCGFYFEKGTFLKEVSEKKTNNVITNSDRFRAKSDEELAKTISGDQIYPWCAEEEPCKYDSCTDCVLAWLKQEADT